MQCKAREGGSFQAFHKAGAMLNDHLLKINDGVVMQLYSP